MKEFFKNELEKIKGQTYISCIPIEEFGSIEELQLFVKNAREKNCGTSLRYETSNFHQGVLVEMFDEETCKLKDCFE